MHPTQPKAYLIGAGIGSIDYLTNRATALVTLAEVLIYDDLVDTHILQLAPPTCQKIYVGKRGGKPSFSQTAINQLLVKYCQEGKIVIRLKSGDAGVFGRIYPEILALKAANCNFELVPGISSALAAPLLAGIPLTEKEISRHFVVVSGHNPENLDWSILAQIDTLVILMGGSALKIIVEKLQNSGRSNLEPVAIITESGRSQQRLWRGTLGDIVSKTENTILSPCIIIIGQVVNLASMPIPSPLKDKTILVTRAVEQSSQFSQLLQEVGAKVLEMPTLAIHPPSSWSELDLAINSLNQFDWLILTSANGVDYFFNRLRTLKKDARDLAGVKIAVVGKKTASSLQKWGLIADYIPADFIADALVLNFPETLLGKKILFPRVETGGREILVQELSHQGAEVIEVPAYQSGCPEKIDPQVWQALQAKTIDTITFASSKTVQNFVTLVNQALGFYPHLSLELLLNNVRIASIGPQTSKTCSELLGRVDVEAKEYTLEGLVEALCND